MVGRNDPCPCGSDKKYKHCCLPKDRAAYIQRVEANRSSRRQKVAAPLDYLESEPVLNGANAGELSPSPEIDPFLERANAFWDDFINASYENQWTMVTEMLAEEPELCDGEMVFEMTNTLFRKALGDGEIERCSQLLDQLEETVPKAYEEESHYILEQRVQIALIEGDDANVEHYFYLFSPLAGDELDMYYRVVSTLAYHGKEKILYEGMRQARLYVAKGKGLVEGAYDEFAEKLGSLEIIHMLAKNPNLTPNDPTLQQHLEEYELTIEPEIFSIVLDYRTGRQIPTWTLADFDLVKGDRKDPAKDRFSCLIAAFTHYIHLEEGVSRTKVDMACDGLVRYLTLRRTGELGKPGQGGSKRQKHRRKQQSRLYKSQHLLCPDAKSLDRYLSDLIGFLSFQYYEAFALFELIPVWLRFLTKYNLLDEEMRLEVLQELNYMKGHLIHIAKKSVFDPTILENLNDWPYES